MRLCSGQGGWVPQMEATLGKAGWSPSKPETQIMRLLPGWCCGGGGVDCRASKDVWQFSRGVLAIAGAAFRQPSYSVRWLTARGYAVCEHHKGKVKPAFWSLRRPYIYPPALIAEHLNAQTGPPLFVCAPQDSALHLACVAWTRQQLQ